MNAFVDAEGKEVKIVSNGMVDISKYISFDCKPLGINEKVSYRVLSEILENAAMMRKLLKKKFKSDAMILFPSTSSSMIFSQLFLIS